MAKKEEIVADLKRLLEEDTTRTKIGRIREIFDEIEELQDAGVSIKNIEALLNKRGFGLKSGNLTSYLYQIRQSRGATEKTERVKPGGAKQPNPSPTEKKSKTNAPSSSKSSSSSKKVVEVVQRTPEDVKAGLNRKIDLKQFKNQD